MADVIGFEPVAWSIDGGRHPATLMRVLAYAAVSGGSGIITPTDCRVRQLTTAGGQVRIDTGAIAIRNMSANVKNQTYIANASTESRLDVQPTTTAKRSDAVIVRLRDPDFSPWELPSGADPATYQYTQPVIIQNVSATLERIEELNLGYSAELLARLDLPPGTSAITDAMIKNKRRMANPRNKPDLLRIDLDGAANHDVSTDQWTNWPASAMEIDIPEWATEMILRVSLEGIGAAVGAVGGQLRAVISPFNGAISVATKSTKFIERDLDSLAGYQVSDRIAIPASIRGTKKYIYPQGAKWTGNAGGSGVLRAGPATSVVYDYVFLETAAV
jgi:hypothetical protein